MRGVGANKFSSWARGSTGGRGFGRGLGRGLGHGLGRSLGRGRGRGLRSDHQNNDRPSAPANR